MKMGIILVASGLVATLAAQAAPWFTAKDGGKADFQVVRGDKESDAEDGTPPQGGNGDRFM